MSRRSRYHRNGFQSQLVCSCRAYHERANVWRDDATVGTIQRCVLRKHGQLGGTLSREIATTGVHPDGRALRRKGLGRAPSWASGGARPIAEHRLLPRDKMGRGGRLVHKLIPVGHSALYRRARCS